jgi:PIN domain nuclease of toxin-antitoxin system
MGLLLDTHVFLWLADDSPQLSKAARDAIWESDRIVLSVASIWELGIKHSLKKLWTPDDDFGSLVQQSIELCDVEILPVGLHHAIAANSLPLLHRDPFDRMLIAQSMTEGLALVSQDTEIRRYDCTVVW